MLQYYETNNEAALRKVELLGEQGDDIGDVSEENFTSFFRQTYNTYFLGQDCGVTHRLLHRMRKERGKF